MKTRTVQLGEVARIGAGQGAPQDGTAFTKDGRPFIRAGSLEVLCENSSDSTLERIPEDTAAKHRLRLYSPNTVVFAKSGMSATKNRIYRLRKPAYVVNHLATLEPGEELDASYLRYWLESFNPTRLIQDIAYPSISQEAIQAVSISLPSLCEQQRIAGQLEQADRLRRTRRYALELSGTFLPAAFLQLFGDLKERASRYEQTAFSDLVASTQLGLVRGAAEMHPDFSYGYLRMDSILGDGDIDYTDLRRVQATPKEAKDFSLCPGDFLFNTRNSRELVGKTGLVTTPPKTCLFNNNIMRVRFHDTVTPEFRMGLFQSPWLKDNLERIKSGTTSVFAIYYKELADLPVVVPPLPLQEQFALLVARHERLRAVQRESLRQAEHLFQSLLHHAFLNP